jgi:hypothetical protein
VWLYPDYNTGEITEFNGRKRQFTRQQKARRDGRAFNLNATLAYRIVTGAGSGGTTVGP